MSMLHGCFMILHAPAVLLGSGRVMAKFLVCLEKMPEEGVTAYVLHVKNSRLDSRNLREVGWIQGNCY